MNIIRRKQIPVTNLAGRRVQTAAGKNAYSPSNKMTMGFARYSDESGSMQPHHHAEEIVYILSAQDAWVEKGDAQDRLGEPIPLEPGLILHIPHLEWHVFRWKPDGHLDILFFYGQVEDIRPEETLKSA